MEQTNRSQKRGDWLWEGWEEINQRANVQICTAHRPTGTVNNVKAGWGKGWVERDHGGKYDGSVILSTKIKKTKQNKTMGYFKVFHKNILYFSIFLFSFNFELYIYGEYSFYILVNIPTALN